MINPSNFLNLQPQKTWKDGFARWQFSTTQPNFLMVNYWLSLAKINVAACILHMPRSVSRLATFQTAPRLSSGKGLDLHNFQANEIV